MAWRPCMVLASLVTHRFRLQDMDAAYDTFGRAAESGAMKVIIQVGP